MKVSIALASYNGERYLGAQLESFLAQTRLPDELVVCDDGSTDRTACIVEGFSKRAPFLVRFERNPCNLGYTRNFEKCLSLCTGDVIFLSDQDDVWMPEKISRVLAEFTGQSERKVVINDQMITDESLHSTGQTIFQNSRKLGFGASWYSAGCCTAMSRAFLDVALPIPSQLISHDGWIHRLALSLGVRVVIDDILQYYRRHGDNTSHSLALRVSKLPVADVFQEFGLRSVERGWLTEIDIARRVIYSCSLGLSRAGDSKGCFAKAIELEERRIRLTSHRIEIVRKPRLVRGRAIWDFFRKGGYVQFKGWRSAVKDIVRP